VAQKRSFEWRRRIKRKVTRFSILGREGVQETELVRQIHDPLSSVRRLYRCLRRIHSCVIDHVGYAWCSEGCLSAA
jgi:hypothetical protein